MKNPIKLFAYNSADSEEVQLEKIAAFLVSGSCTLAGVIWTIMYCIVFGWGLVAFLPIAFVIIVGSALLLSHLTRNHYYTIYAQIASIIYIPTFIQWSIGGLFDSGLVLAWAIVGPICALMFFSIRQSIPWFVLYLVNLFITVIFDNYFKANGHLLSEHVRVFFFIMNLGFASVVVFIFASYYVNAAVREQKKATKLLEANLQQEIILRESEKLATLGKLSAGVAHELNNPAASIQRGIQQLQESITQLADARFRLGQLNLSAASLEMLNTYSTAAEQKAPEEDALKRNDLESELETALDTYDIENAWKLAPLLVSAGVTMENIGFLGNSFSKKELPLVLDFIAAAHMTYSLLREMKFSSERVVDIVGAMRSYTFLDQADNQRVDIHKGLDDTLLMLKGQLDENITIRKDYDRSLPQIDVYAGELNQVWTNIIDNALDALNGKGTLGIRTFRENNWAMVQISDDGPGIAKELQSRIFDPFFTTKPAGQGSGLGLNVSHNIIVKKHKGQISVDSRPGETCFTVKLPLS